MHTNPIGYLPGHSMVWYHKNSIANILSLANVKTNIRELMTVQMGTDLWFISQVGPLVSLNNLDMAELLEHWERICCTSEYGRRYRNLNIQSIPLSVQL